MPLPDCFNPRLSVLHLKPTGALARAASKWHGPRGDVAAAALELSPWTKVDLASLQPPSSTLTRAPFAILRHPDEPMTVACPWDVRPVWRAAIRQRQNAQSWLPMATVAAGTAGRSALLLAIELLNDSLHELMFRVVTGKRTTYLQPPSPQRSAEIAGYVLVVVGLSLAGAGMVRSALDTQRCLGRGWQASLLGSAVGLSLLCVTTYFSPARQAPEQSPLASVGLFSAQVAGLILLGNRTANSFYCSEQVNGTTPAPVRTPVARYGLVVGVAGLVAWLQFARSQAAVTPYTILPCELLLACILIPSAMLRADKAKEMRAATTHTAAHAT